MTMKFCSVSGCKESITEKQAETTEKLYGTAVCDMHAIVLQVEADKAAEQFIPPEHAALKASGWEIDNGFAFKTVDRIGVSINLAKLSERGKAVEVAGKPFLLGVNEKIDTEVMAIFKKTETGHGRNGKPVQTIAPEKAPAKIAAPRSESGGLGNSLATIQDIALTPENIIALICSTASMNEAVLFLQVCKLRGLNPFVPGEVFLIKMEADKPAVTVVGKYAFLKKADSHPDYLGYSAGIIVRNTDGKVEEREGTFYLPSGNNPKPGDVFEVLLGGWARIKRKGREDCIEKVSLAEAIKRKKDGSPVRAWVEQPAVMIRKVAVVRGHREAFPAELGGLFEPSEVEAREV